MVARAREASGRSKAVATLVALMVATASALVYVEIARANVTVTAGSATATADQASSGTFVAVSTITVAEGNKQDFGSNTGGTWPTTNVTLATPTGWEYDTATAPTYTPSGGNLATVTSVYGSNTSLVITLTGSGKNSFDSFTIANLRVRPTSTNPLFSGSILPTGVNNIDGITPGLTVFADLTETAGAAARLALSGASSSTAGANSGSITATITDDFGNVTTRGSDTIITPSSSSTSSSKAFKTTGGSPQATFTITAGTSTVSFLYYDEAAGSYSITLTNDSSLTNPAAYPFTVSAAAATQIALSGATSSTAGVNSGSITATLQDQFGNTATRGSDTIITPSSSSTSGSKVFKTTGGTPQATFTITAGTSTVSFLYYDETAGSYSITLTNDGGLTNPAAYGFTVNAAAASALELSGASSSTAGANSASITATLRDSFGNAATRGSNTIITPASSSTSGSKVFKTTGGTPQATFTITAGTSTVSFLYYDETAGSYSITLTNDASLTNPSPYGFTVNPATATKLAISGPSSATAGVNSTAFTATLQDAFDNTATRGSDTIITPASSSTSGSKVFKTTGGSPQATYTITAGTSTVQFLYYDEAAGSYNVTLTNDSSLTNPAAHPITINAAAATALTLSGASSSTAGVNSASITATLVDIFGNSATRGSNTIITPASSSTSGSKVFKTTGGTPQATFTITAGSSTVSFLYYDETAGAYTITLTNDASLTNPAPYGFIVNAAAATKIALSGPASVTAGVNSTAFTATLQDAFDNTATRGSDTVITPASSSSSGSKVFKTTGGSPQATYTITAGSSTVSFLYYDETAGAYNITLTNDASLTNPAAHPITVNAAAATKLALSGPASVTAGVDSTAFTATLQDQFDNTATRGSDTVITPASSSTSGSKVFKTTGGSPQATYTITAGSSTVSFLYYDETAGAYNITLTNDASLTNPAAHPITVNAAATTKIALSGPASVTAGVNTTAFTATLQDQFDNTATRGSDTVITPASSSTSGSKVFKTTGGSPQATYTITAGSSTVSFLYYDETAGAYNITLTNDASLTNPAAHPITVNAAAVTKIALSGPASVTAGVNTTAFTATLQDAFDNTATRGSDTVITPASSSTSGSKVFKTTGGTPQATYTITAGSSTVSFLYYDETAGAYNITLTNDASLTNPAAHPITVNAAAVTKIALSGPASVTAGQDSTLFTATLQDQFDNAATRGSDTVITPASSSSSFTKAFKTVGGVTQATFTITAGSSSVTFRYYDETAGSYNVTLTNDSSLTNPAAHPITVDAAAATKIALSGPASVTAGVDSAAFTATLQDQFDNTATRGLNTIITPASSSTSGSKVFKTTGGTPQVTFTITAGSSTVQFLYYDETAGAYNITLTDDSGLSDPAAHPITVNAAAATKIALSGPASVTAGVDSTLFTATLQDAFDNTATRGSDTVITPASSSTSGSKVFKITGGTPQVTFTITAGTPTVSFLYYDETAGSYNITLTDDSGLSDPAAHPITVNAAAATKLAVSGPASVTAGVNTTAFTATLQDQFDNTATRGSDTVITPASSSTSGSKVFKTTGGSPQATFTITAGMSTVSFLYYDEAAGSYNVTLTNDSSLTNPAAHPITVNAAAATKLALSGPASVTAGLDSTLFTATLQDQFDNTATRGSDTVTTPASSSTSGSKDFKTAAGASQATFTITAGTSTVTFRYYDEAAGSYNVTLTNDSSLTNPAAHPITVDAAAATKIVLSGPASATAGQNSALFTATLQDQFDNTATRGSDTVITPASSSTSGTKAFKTAGGTTQATFTITAGTSTVQFRYYDETAGSYNVTITNDSSLTNPAAHPITVDPAAAAQLAITSVNGGSNPVAGTPFAVVVRSQDQFGNFANVSANTDVALSVATGSGTLGGTTNGTISAGSSSVTISGVTYSTPESGVSLTATRTSGDTLTAGTSATFTVDPGAVKLAITSPTSASSLTVGSFSVTVQSQDATDTAAPVGADTNVSLSLNTGTGSLGGTITGTITAGTSSVTIVGVTYDKAESGVVLTATRTSGDTLTPGDSESLTFGPGPLDHFAVTNTSNGPIGTQTAGVGFDVKVVAQDEFDNTVTGFTGTVDLSSNKTCSAGCTTSAAFIAGVLSSHSVTLTQAAAGDATITATESGDDETGTSNTFTVNAAAATKIALSGPGSVTAGLDSALFTATLQDQFDNTATRGSDTVITPASSSTSGSKVFKTTGGSPQATFTITAGTSTVQFRYYDETAGAYNVTLTNDSALTNPAAHPITVNAAAATEIVLSGPGSVTAGVDSTLFTATLQDQFDNTATRGSDTVITPASSSTSGSKDFKTAAGASQATFTIAAGTSTVTLRYYDEAAGSYNVTLTNDSSLTNPAAHPITVNAAAATKIVLSGPGSVTAGVNTTAFTATLQDAFDNTAARGSDTVITPASSSSSGSKVFKTTGGSPQATYTITAGSSTVQFLYYDEAAGSYNITLTNDSSLTNPAAHPITVNADAATMLAVSGPASATAGQNSALFTATLQDQFDNTATRGSDTIITPASSSTSGSKDFKTAAGASQATFTITAGTSAVTFRYYDEAAGSYNVTLTNDASLTNPAAHPITVDAAAPTKIVLSGPGSVTAGVDSTLFTATLQDQFDNTATRGSDTVITPATTSGSGVFKTAGGTTQATFTITSGASTVTFRYYDETAGSYTITLTNDSSLANPAGHAIDVDPAAATKIALSGPGSVTAGQDSALFAATLQDAFDNSTTRGSDTIITPASSSTSGSKDFKTAAGASQATFTITAGTSTVTFRYYDEAAGSYNVTLTNDSSLTNPAAHPITVNAAAATKLALSGPASVTAGQDSALFTATLQDQFDNTATRGSDTIITPASSSTSGSKDFKTAAGASQATFTITAGTSAVSFRYYDEAAGSYNVTLTNDASLANPAAHAIDVDPAAASQIVLSGATSTVAGENSGLITATLQDPFDNVATRGSDTLITPASSSTSGTKAFKTAAGVTQATFTITGGTSAVSFRYYDETGGTYDLTLTNDASLTNPPAYGFQVYAAHGSGTLSADPTAVSASQSERTIVFTYTAASGGMNDGAVRVTVPGGWSAPSTTASAAGYTTASVGTVGVSGQEITVTGVTLAGGATFTITYGDTSGSGPGATAPAATGAQTWNAEQRSTSGGSLTALAASPAITVHAADGSGTLSADTSEVVASQSGTIVFTYTAASGGMNDGAVRVTVPGGWSAPSTTASAAGHTTASAGTVGVSGQEITVTGVTLAGGATLTITYGAAPGPGATASSSTGAQTWQGAQRSTAAGVVTNLGASPAITVYAADGSGTIDVAPATVTASSTGNELEFTYTAAAGGMNDGEVRIVVPTSWPAPTGITATDTGTLNISGHTITVENVMLAGGAPMTITYGVGGVTAPDTPESVAWTTSQKSIAGGAFTALAAQPTVTVEAIDGAGSIVVAPNEVSADSDVTLTFTYTAGAAGMTDGEVVVDVPSAWSGGSISSGTITLAPGATTDIVYSGTARSSPGAQTWTVEQRGTSGGTFTELTSGSPTVTVFDEDGSGSIVSDTSYVVNGSMNNTIEFTYTAAALAGGMSEGTIEIDVPGNWAAPAPGDVSSSVGTAGVSGNTITVTDVTLAQGASMTITLTNADAPTTGGAQTWTTRQASTAAGALDDLDDAPSIVVSSAPDVPTLVSPADGTFVTAPPTLTASFSDPDAADTGTITFEVYDSTCTTLVGTAFDSPGGIANPGNGSANAADLTEGVTYCWRAKATDSDGVSSAFSGTRSFTVDGTGPTIDSVEVSEGGADSHASGDEFFYRPGAAGGTFTVTVDASDPAGMKHVTFPDLGGGPIDDTTAPYARTYPWDGTFAESGSKTVTAVDDLDNSTNDTFTVTPDSAAPSGGTISVPQFSGSQTITITSASYTDAGSGIASNVITRSEAPLTGPDVCGSFTGATVVTSPDTVAGGKCYRYTLSGTDNVGNSATTSSTVLVDTTPPSAPALTLSESAPDLHATGTTLWFNGGAASGDFTVAAASADAQSGIAKLAFPALAGIVGGGDDTTSPYSADYSWTGGAPDEQLDNDVVAHNKAGLTDATPFDLKEDSTAPSGGSISVPAYSGSLTVTIGTTSYGDSGSGIASNVITRSDAQAPDSPGVCPPAGGYTGATVVTSPDTVPPADDGMCVEYTFTGTDNVGNAATATDTVLVDTTPPSQPDLSLSTISTGVYADNANDTVWFKPGTASGDFTVNATTTDDESGVEHVSFGAAGSLSAPPDDTTEPYERTYSWGSAPTGGTGSVSAFNNAGLASPARTFDFTADGTAPTGGSISVPAYSGSLTVTIGTTDFVDSPGSGIASNVITRSDAQPPDSPGVCPAGGYTGATVVTSPDTVPPADDGMCVEYTFIGTDNVGNAATATDTVLVDTTPPAIASLTLAESAPNLHANGTTLWFKPGTPTGSFDVTMSVSDGQSAMQKVTFPAIAGLSGGGDVSPPGPFPMTYSWTSAPAPLAGNAVTAFNNASGSSAATFDLSADGAGPSGGSISYPDGAQTDSAPDLTVTLPADGQSGLASLILQQIYHGADCSSPGTPTDRPEDVSAGGTDNVVLDQGFGCYTFQLRAVDNVGNVSTITSSPLSEYELTGSASLETVELAAPESQHFALGNVYLNTEASGSFQLKVTNAVAPDVVSVDFPAIPGLTGSATTDNSAPFESDVYGWDGTFTGSGLVTVTLHMAIGPDREEQIQALVDTTAPVTSDDTAAIGNDWKSSAQTVTLTPDDDGSGVSAVYYTTDGSTPTPSSASGTAVTLNASGVYTIKYFAVDNVGNAGAVQTASTQIRIDLDDPANSFAATAVDPAGTAFVNGTDVWYQGGTAGSFALEDTITDADSGAASATFPALAQAEWTKSSETVTSPPYVSSLFTRTAAASGSFAYAVTSADLAGNGTSTTLTFREDSTAPATGDNYGAIGSTWYSTQTLTLTPDDGAGSGVGATFYSLDGGATYAPGSSVTLSTTGVYNVTFYSVDNVGNAEAPPRTVGPIRIDATAPVNSVSVVGTSPAGSAVLNGTTLFYRGAAAGSFQLENALPALDSGPFGTTFGAVSAPNWTAKAPETVTTPAGGPYTSSAFSWTAGTADFALSVSGQDNAGNSTETQLTVTDDSAAPLVSDDTASITDAWRNTDTTVTLTASDSGSGVAAVYYTTDGSTPTTASAQGTTISLTFTGVYTIKYFAVDNVGNASAVQTGAAQIRIDKIDPSGAVTDPAPGATLSGTAAQLSATGSDTISGIASVQFQVRPDGSMGAFSNAGLPVTMPPYDGTWDTTTTANGDYELRAFVTDLAGNTFATATRTIAVDNVPPSGPATTVIPAGTMTDTILPVPGTLNTVTVPGGSAIETLVIRTEARLDLESTPPAGSSFGGNVVEVEACVAGTGVSTASVDDCLATGGTPLTELPMLWKVNLLGTGFPAGSPDGSGWSELTTEIGAPAEAANYDESYLATGGGYDLYVKHLSFFTLLVPQQGAIALARPGLVGVVQYGLLKLRWTPSSGPAPVAYYRLVADGAVVSTSIGPKQTEEILGPFSAADTRVFELQAVDIRGRISPLSNAVTSVPSLMGLTVAEARAALAGRGFAGILADSFAAEGDVVVRQSPAAPALATVGSAVTLVTAGGEGHAALRIQVSNSLRIVLGLHTLNVRVALTAPAMVSAKLFSRNRFVRTKTGRLVRWETFYKPRRVEAGATIVPFRLPRTLSRPGAYVLLVTARSTSGGTVTQSRTPITVVRPAVQRIVVGQARVDVPVTLVQPSIVKVQLVSKAKLAKTKKGKRVPWRKTWSGRRVGSGTTILSLPLPRSLTKPGAYRLVVISRAVATGKVTRRQLPVTVVRKASPEKKSVDVVVLTGKDVTPDMPLKPDEGVTINQADDADQVFTTTSTPSANVQVIVIDVGATEDVELIRQLRLVYPDLKIIAVVPQGLGPATREAGATIVVMKPASPELISTLINQLATNGNGSGRGSRG